MTTDSGNKLEGHKRNLITDFFKNNGDSAKKQKRSVATKATKNTKVELKSTSIKNPETIPVQEMEKDLKQEQTKDEPLQNKFDTINKVEKEEDFSSVTNHFGFDKEQWLRTLTEEHKQLLALEINQLHISWLAALHKELTKPYFISLKKFLLAQKATVFPPQNQIYSWSHYTPLPNIKCLVIGQDPYHNYNQAHGLAFSVLEPTRPPPSLLNIYKTLAIDYDNFQIPDYKELSKQGRPGGGNLTKWARRGVLLLNNVLTVECHKANSHANRGWETFTEKVIETAITFHQHQKQGFVIMAWGSPAQKRVDKFSHLLRAQSAGESSQFEVIKTVHPSPLSASRGFFTSRVFRRCNDFLEKQNQELIDWGIMDGNVVL
ncbi:hypothetical protein G9P44_000901 [Scheffersomyces stipitis]|nr:hypothetical protein G9P44_000901 [Scheffersomyces stipitis]